MSFDREISVCYYFLLYWRTGKQMHHFYHGYSISISRTYGLFKASLRISHCGTNQSTIHTKTLNPKVFYSNFTFNWSYANKTYFYKKLRKHCLVQRCWYSKQNHPTLMASKITVIRKSDFMDPMNLFPSDAKVTCTCQQDCTYKYIWDGLKSNYVN